MRMINVHDYYYYYSVTHQSLKSQAINKKKTEHFVNRPTPDKYKKFMKRLAPVKLSNS